MSANKSVRLAADRLVRYLVIREDSVIPVLTTDERDKTDLFLFALEKHEGIASINPFYRFYPWLFQLPNALDYCLLCYRIFCVLGVL